MQQQYVLEWSKSAGCFHVAELQTTLHNNLKAFVNNKALKDYHILLIGTYDEVTEAADRLRGDLLSRRKEGETL